MAIGKGGVSTNVNKNKSDSTLCGHYPPYLDYSAQWSQFVVEKFFLQFQRTTLLRESKALQDMRVSFIPMTGSVVIRSHLPNAIKRALRVGNFVLKSL